MKKLLLSLFLLFPFLTMSADVCSVTFSQLGYDNAQEVTTVAMDNDITLVFDKGTSNVTPKYYNTGTAVRLYGGNQLTVSGAEGVTITDVMIAFQKSNPIVEGSTVTEGELTIYADNNVATWSGNANSFMLTEGGTTGHARIVSVTVDYYKGEAPAIAAVQYSVPSGAVAVGTKVELTTATKGASIYYTTNGEEPTQASTLYDAPIVINEDVTISAIAVKDGEQSAATSASYTVIQSYASLSEIVALAPQTKFVCGVDLTVFESQGAYVFVYEPVAKEYALIYKYDLGLVTGNVIEAGWIGTVNAYGRLNQLVPDATLTVADVEGVMPKAEIVTEDNIAEILVDQNVRKPYILKGVKMKDAYDKKNGYGILGETEINLYNQFSIDVENIAADDVYYIYGILNSFNGNLQINPLKFTEPVAAEPVYTSVGEVYAEDEDYGESMFEALNDVKVEVYDDYVILRAFAGVEGFDLKVGIGEDEQVSYLQPIVKGEEGEVCTSGYCNVRTGISDAAYFQPYLGEGYCYAALYDDESGYVFLNGYFKGEYTYYYCAWSNAIEPTYTSLGQVTETEGWGATKVPAIDDVTVEAYEEEEYVIIRAFAGVEGYDLKVGLGESDAVTYLTSIVDGVEGDTYTSGYCDIPTGRDDIAYMRAYLGSGYCYAGLYDDENGYVILYCYWGEDWTYYYCVWPQGDGEQGEWVNPFEAEATYLYSSVGETTSMEDEEDASEEDSWGESVFPVVKDINVDVYDTYIYIKNIAGVEGYGAKVAYNADDEVLSIMPVENGVEGDACKNYTYISTGIEAVDKIQAYCSYSYAQSNEDKSGYVLLSAYLYGANDLFEWNYYYLVWSEDMTSVATIAVKPGATVYFDLKGNVVDKPAAGNIYIRVADGKAQKVLVK